VSLIINPYAFGSVGPTDPYFANVVSLLHFRDGFHTTTFTDITGKTWSRNGIATENDVNALFVGSAVGPATNNGIKTPTHADFNFGTADFTIEWFHFFTSLSDFQNAFDRGGVTAGALLVQTGNSDGKFITYVGGSAVMTEASAATTSVMQHHALVKDSGTLRKYRGGVQTASVANATSITNTAAFAWGAYASGANSTAGYLGDGCRITNGVCRYPGGTTFTPPALGSFPDS
jgi:hypothetical protein